MKYITVSPELRKACEAKMEETLDICRKKYGKDIPTPPLKFAHLGRRAGICQYVMPSWINNHTTTATIIINPDFFVKYYDDMLNDTVPHEVAHYISVFIHGERGSGHGWLWKSVMHAIGLSGDRCHTYSMEGVKTRRPMPFKYTCGCDDGTKEHLVSSVIHRKHQLALSVGRKGYRCQKCRQHLVYQGIVDNGKFIPAKKTPSEPTKEVPSYTFNLPVVPRPIERPITVTEPESKFRTVTRFVNGMLTNVKVPLEA